MKLIEIVHSKEEQAFERLADIVLQKLEDREANKPETDEELSEPRGSVEIRPTGVTSKPANGCGPGRDPFYPAFS
jgi:hypothetical protein